MSKFIRNIALFVAGLPLLTTKSLSAVPGPRAEIEPLDPMSLPDEHSPIEETATGIDTPPGPSRYGL